MKLTSIRWKRNQNGAALVEMALILPLLMTLVFGIIEFGWMLKTYQAVGQCAREGVRSAVLGSEPADARTRVVDTGTSLYKFQTPVDPSKIAIDYRVYYIAAETGHAQGTWGDWTTMTANGQAPSDENHYSQIRVTVTYDYPLITGKLFDWSGRNDGLVPLKQSVVMRKE